jgi:hypothetical protein
MSPEPPRKLGGKQAWQTDVPINNRGEESNEEDCVLRGTTFNRKTVAVKPPKQQEEKKPL